MLCLSICQLGLDRPSPVIQSVWLETKHFRLTHSALHSPCMHCVQSSYIQSVLVKLQITLLLSSALRAQSESVGCGRWRVHDSRTKASACRLKLSVHVSAPCICYFVIAKSARASFGTPAVLGEVTRIRFRIQDLTLYVAHLRVRAQLSHNVAQLLNVRLRPSPSRTNLSTDLERSRSMERVVALRGTQCTFCPSHAGLLDGRTMASGGWAALLCKVQATLRLNQGYAPTVPPDSVASCT